MIATPKRINAINNVKEVDSSGTMLGLKKVGQLDLNTELRI